jgi:hypothetical protein
VKEAGHCALSRFLYAWSISRAMLEACARDRKTEDGETTRTNRNVPPVSGSYSLPRLQTNLTDQSMNLNS